MIFKFNNKRPFIISDLDGTLFHLNGDWARVQEMSKPYKNVMEASKNAFKNNDKHFFENLNKLELIKEPTPLKFMYIFKQMDIEKYIVTNNTAATAQYINQQYNLNANGIVGIDQVSEGKPSSEGIKKILDEFKLDPKVGYYIGNQKTDKEAAISAGLSFIDVSIFNC